MGGFYATDPERLESTPAAEDKKPSTKKEEPSLEE